MFWRFAALMLCLAGGAFAGHWVHPWISAWFSDWEGAAVGATLGAVAWLMGDTWRAGRLLEWLRSEEFNSDFARHGIWADVTTRVRRLLRERDRALKASDDRLQQFLSGIQASPNGVVLLDAEKRIAWCNQTAAQHFGLDATRDQAQYIGNLVRDPEFTRYLQDGDYSQPIVIGSRDDPGQERSYALQIHPYGEGQSLLLSRDITERERAETMRRDFVANVSHEIRTPLTVLSGFIETMQSLPLEDAERARYLALMDREARRMQVLVADLLTLSRLEGSPIPGTDQWSSIAELWASCEADARALDGTLVPGTAAAHQLTFTTDSDMALRQFAGEPMELLTAMSNLVANALRYTPAGGRVTVSWRSLGVEGAEFAVEDSGPGIAPEHLPRLTERFYRVDRSRSRETGGTGLGLAIVKHVVQRHGGALHIESTPGRGSRFSFRLPAARLRQPA